MACRWAGPQSRNDGWSSRHLFRFNCQDNSLGGESTLGFTVNPPFTTFPGWKERLNLFVLCCSSPTPNWREPTCPYCQEPSLIGLEWRLWSRTSLRSGSPARIKWSKAAVFFAHTQSRLRGLYERYSACLPASFRICGLDLARDAQRSGRNINPAEFEAGCSYVFPRLQE